MCVPNFFRLHTCLEVWSHISYNNSNSTDIAGPQLMCPCNICEGPSKYLTRPLVTWYSYICQELEDGCMQFSSKCCTLLPLPFRAVYWLLSSGGIEHGVIGGEAGECALLPFLFHFVRGIPNQCCLSLLYRVFSETVLSVVFHECHGGCSITSHSLNNC